MRYSGGLNHERAERQLALLAEGAGGPWAGTPWPEGLLDAATGRIGGLAVPVVSPQAQIEIKRMMPVWDPSRPRRAKDAEDIARLEAGLRRHG
ncbi:hypothetical protein ABZ865_37070 [Streptomyces sp. NPDC047085]|uniref:hypothetical protein n=1 Tax=Streptomyces sp. NPDC047085 TaxID=3155140 RepID=UPI00340FF222